MVVEAVVSLFIAVVIVSRAEVEMVLMRVAIEAIAAILQIVLVMVVVTALMPYLVFV